MRRKQEARRAATFLVWVIGWMVELFVIKRAEGGGRSEEVSFLKDYFKSRLECIWRQEESLKMPDQSRWRGRAPGHKMRWRNGTEHLGVVVGRD